MESLINRLIAETKINLSEAASLFPSRKEGKPLSTPTLMRWILAGIVINGQAVRLEALRVCGKWITSHEAVERFILAQNPVTALTAPLPRSVPTRNKAAERAGKQLEDLGA